MPESLKLPGLDVGALSETCSDLNAYVRPGVLRAYQRDLLERGTFLIRHPGNAAPISPDASVFLPRSRVGYYFGGPEPFWLCTSGIKDGFPISSLYASGQGGYQPLRRPAMDLPPDAVAVLLGAEKALAAGGVASREGSERPPATLVVGHRNFAHHLWNELPALQAWAELPGAGIGPVTLHALHEPLGPLEALIPSLKPRLARSARSIAPGAIRRPSLLVRVGSEKIPPSVQQLVKDYCGRRVEGPLKTRLEAFAGANSPRIWISLRRDKRACLNFHDFLARLVPEVIDRYPQAGFLFDGFSTPIDYLEGDYEAVAEEFSARIADANREVSRLVERVEELRPGFGARTIDLSGVSIADAIFAGGYADYYICNTGTLQHKIGWLHKVPGVVHMPPTPNINGIAKWYGGIVPNSGPISLLPNAFVSHVGFDAKVLDRNQNYRITDIPSAVGFVLEDMATNLRR